MNSGVHDYDLLVCLDDCYEQLLILGFADVNLPLCLAPAATNTKRECKWKDLAKHQLPTDIRAWTQDSNKETPAFLFLLSKLPVVDLPRDLYQHAEMKVSGTKTLKCI